MGGVLIITLVRILPGYQDTSGVRAPRSAPAKTLEMSVDLGELFTAGTYLGYVDNI